ncbi:MAG: hypothetical protein WC328_02855 [Kiritimatiellia bacterium]
MLRIKPASIETMGTNITMCFQEISNPSRASPRIGMDAAAVSR